MISDKRDVLLALIQLANDFENVAGELSSKFKAVDSFLIEKKEEIIDFACLWTDNEFAIPDKIPKTIKSSSS